MNEKQLTVVITTYNRKQPLLEQLQSLEKQGKYDKYEIIVSDNCSDYDVDAWLDNQLSSEFRQIVTVYNRKYNVGGDLNIAFSFQLVDTPWMWLLSDDDITEPDALDIIFDDITKHQDICWIKYSISGVFSPFVDFKTNQLEELFYIFSTKPHFAGEMIFMSNNIYHIKAMKNHISRAPLMAGSCYSQLIPPFFAMKYDGIQMMLSSKALTNYVAGRISYSLNYAYIRFGNILYSDLKLSKAEIKAFKRLNFSSMKNYILSLLSEENKAIRWNYFKKIFIDHYSLLSIKGLAFLFLFTPLHLLNIRLQTLIKLKNKVKRSGNAPDV